MAFHYFMRLPLQLVSLLSLKLAVPATRVTGTFQNNSVDGTSSAFMGPGQAGWAEERELGSRSPMWCGVPHTKRRVWTDGCAPRFTLLHTIAAFLRHPSWKPNPGF